MMWFPHFIRWCFHTFPGRDLNGVLPKFKSKTFNSSGNLFIFTAPHYVTNNCMITVFNRTAHIRVLNQEWHGIWCMTPMLSELSNWFKPVAEWRESVLSFFFSNVNEHKCMLAAVQLSSCGMHFRCGANVGALHRDRCVEYTTIN
jgi:hypothetical protein